MVESGKYHGDRRDARNFGGRRRHEWKRGRREGGGWEGS